MGGNRLRTELDPLPSLKDCKWGYLVFHRKKLERGGGGYHGNNILGVILFLL